MRLSLRRNTVLWLLFVLGTLVLATVLLTRMLLAGDRTALLVGETTGVHHQFEVACETCHQAKPFATTKKIMKELNKTCRGCHNEELAESNDSHPRKKFKPPRMARFWEKIDARDCTSCHLEHKPEITAPGAVTLAMDYCVACHSVGEQDVRVNRPSHAGLTFDTCASAGCHNFHDNRALYEDFLVKHGKDPWLSAAPIHEASAKARARLRGAVTAYLAKAEAAPAAHRDDEAAEHWAASAHAAADVGCEGCHAPKAKTADEIEAQWVVAPEYAVCSRCHRAEANTFAQGRHGMRGHKKIAKARSAKRQLQALGWKKPDKELVAIIDEYLVDARPPKAMTAGEARIPMKPDAHDAELNCGTCHKPHEQDLRTASVEACASCHDDGHTKAYFDSPHYGLWKAELSGVGAPGSGVSCATCHLLKEEKGGKVVTDHNQNTGLRPNEKMIRPVCMSCHGLGFSIDALADPDLVSKNFKGRPARHIESIDWALRRVETSEQGANR